MGLLAYSGITTKVRAMESRLLKPEQFQELAEQEDVRSAADYLKEQPAYAEVFEGLDDTKLHRGYMEQILTQSEYRDFTRLYRFSGVKQRRFLDLYFKHYEVEVIKKLLRHVLGGREGQPDLSMFQDFFEKHSDLNLELLRPLPPPAASPCLPAAGNEPVSAVHRFQTGRTSDIQLLSNQMLNRIYGKTGHRYPHSPAVLDSYLYRKELEMRKIITALEGIRYGLPAAEIMGLLAKQ